MNSLLFTILSKKIILYSKYSHVEFPFKFFGKVEKIQEDSLDSIPSPSPSVKIQIIGEKV